MKIRLVFEKEGYDNVVAWTDVKTIVVDIPDKFKGYHVTGAEEVLENEMLDKLIRQINEEIALNDIKVLEGCPIPVEHRHRESGVLDGYLNVLDMIGELKREENLK